jgi:hypothetical protein
VIFVYGPNLLGSSRMRRNSLMGRRIASPSSFVVADFVADDAAYRGTADGAEHAAVGKHSAATTPTPAPYFACCAGTAFER